MWAAIRELMEQFDDAVIVLDEEGEIAVMNRTAKAQIERVGSLDGVSGIRVLRVPSAEKLTVQPEPLVLPVPHLDHASSHLPVVLAIRSEEKYLYISPAHVRIYGSQPETFFNNVHAFLDIVHPDDLAYVQERFDADRSGDPQEYYCRALHADGEYRRLHVRIHPFFDHASGQLLVASLVEDVTQLQAPQASRGPAQLPLQHMTTMSEFRSALGVCVDQWRSELSAPFFAVAFVDLARFRAVNDSFGYSEGDRLLHEVGRRIEAALPGVNRLASFGSDRFGLLICDALEPADADKTVRLVLKTLDAPFSLSENTIQVSARVGLAYPQGMDCTVDMLLRDADAALQLAKQRREALVVSTNSRAIKASEQAPLEFDLIRALDSDEFFFEFQPAFDPQTGQVRLLEALVRWRHPRLGVISPSAFISLAEDSGLVLRMDMQGLERLSRQLDYWRTVNPAICDVPISINISGRHFPNFVMEKQFHKLLNLPAIRDARIIFEITESVFVDSNPRTAAGLERLREAGVEIWLDDFGDGYSSFRYIAHFPIDGIKISESFVKNCAQEQKSRVILSSIQTLARGLGVQMIVEGVENLDQFETLRTMGFEVVQGYYLSKPLAARDIPALFADPRSNGKFWKYPA